MAVVADIFHQDMFGLVSMTKSLLTLPVTPSKIGRMGLFRDQPVTTLQVGIEEAGGRLVLIPTAARGTMPNLYTTGGRKARIFAIPHIPLNASVLADDVQGIRDWDSDDAAVAVVALVNQKMEGMKQSMEATFEWHRIGAIHGEVKDADGVSVLYNLFTEFGIVQKTVNFDLSIDAETGEPTAGVGKLKEQALEVIMAIEDALGMSPYGHIHAMCGDAFFAALVKHPDVKEAYKDDDNFVRDQNGVKGAERVLEYGGVTWENYRGGVGAFKFINTDHARFFPVGVPDLFERFLAPAPFNETVNTLGKEMYAKQKPKEWDLGTDLHINSSPLFMCNRPASLVKGVRTAG